MRAFFITSFSSIRAAKLYDFPEAARRELLAAQVVADAIVTGGGFAFEVLGQVSAGIVIAGGNQVLDVLLLRHMLLYAKTQAKVLMRLFRSMKRIIQSGRVQSGP